MHISARFRGRGISWFCPLCTFSLTSAESCALNSCLCGCCGCKNRVLDCGYGVYSYAHLCIVSFRSYTEYSYEAGPIGPVGVILVSPFQLHTHHRHFYWHLLTFGNIIILIYDSPKTEAWRVLVQDCNSIHTIYNLQTVNSIHTHCTQFNFWKYMHRGVL